MTVAARRERAAVKYADSFRAFRHGDMVRCRRNDENCVVIGVWHDWLWLNPIDYRDAAPFSGHAYERSGWATLVCKVEPPSIGEGGRLTAIEGFPMMFFVSQVRRQFRIRAGRDLTI